MNASANPDPPPVVRTAPLALWRIAEAFMHMRQPLAERYEAVLRAYNNPLPFARRLARALCADRSRLARIELGPPPLRRVMPADEFAETDAPFRNAIHHFSSA